MNENKRKNLVNFYFGFIVVALVGVLAWCALAL